MAYIGKQPTKAALTASDIEDGIITAAKIEDGAVVAAEIASNAVTTAKINADAVTSAKIADDAINSEHYTDGSIDTAHIAADQIVASLIADNAINSEHYTDGSVDTAHIADANVTTAKIADDAITLAKMAAGTDGNIISFDASGNPVAIATGNDGQVLTSTGAGSPPAFEDVSGGVTFKQAGANFTGSLLVGHADSGTLSSANYNTGVGIGALDALTSGINCVALGYNALTVNTVGTENIAIGSYALDAQVDGDKCVAIGLGALGKATNNQCVAVGDRALDNVTSGHNNIALGSESGAKSNWLNWTTESDRLTLGNYDITHAYVKVDWTVGSDIRDKTNFGTIPHGIDFVKQLNPISYQFRTARDEDTTIGGVKYGFSAQDILALEKANGGTNVIVDDEFEEHLNFTNSHLTPILVNAIKELEARVKTLEDA